MINHKEQLKLLDEEAQKLKTSCEFRSAEIDNIRAIIYLADIFPKKFVETTLEIRVRLQELRERPDYAGKHEIHKKEQI